MTAEIAILNKNAVALAADSAVTLRNPETQKVYNTANKLFMLSKYHPVGIMVYGPAYLMGIPWETVIKTFRDELHVANFAHLGEFAECFFLYLENNQLLFPPSVQEDSLRGMCEYVLSQIRDKIDLRVKARLTQAGQIDDDEVQQTVEQVVIEDFATWEQYRRLACFPGDFEEQLVVDNQQLLLRVLDSVFDQLPLEAVRERLLQICAYRVTKEWWSLNASGVVIAGFGKDDILPVVQTYRVEHVTSRKLKRELEENLSNDMNQSQIATIIPFAQADIVARFIRGIDPEYRAQVSQFLDQLLTKEYPAKLLGLGEIADENEKAKAEAELVRLGQSILRDFESSWSGWEHRKFIGPVLEIVGDLPKDDLAAMAESLVNLTSFKRRITAETETVGGPIDVAVISKGDGFVWIKRKHYFQKDLNPAFFANYYRRDA